MECWFCEKNISDGKHDISLEFERYNYADKIAQQKGEQPDKIKHTLVVPRCERCYMSHKKHNYISLFSLIPFTIMAFSLFMLFRDVNDILVFVIMAISLLGFGVVVALRSVFLKRRGVKALVQMEMQNEDIRAMLANGWYRG